MPHLAKILIYPIKSLSGIEVTEARLLEGGALAHDREFVMVDEQGRFVNGKRTAKVHLLRSTYDLANRGVTLEVQGDTQTASFHLDDDRAALETWLSEYFGYPVTLQQNLHMGFPDDTEASGPTVVSTTTLETIASWFPDLSTDEIRHRFRANLEIADVPAFWEDQLFGQAGELVPFQIGDVTLWGSHPCQRCVVVTRDHLTGESYQGFQKAFTTQRKATLPSWANPSRFNHFYRLTLNTIVYPSEAGKVLRVGRDVNFPICEESDRSSRRDGQDAHPTG
ncbi:MOSC domain-containing protein [filamentous cyanobacterium CCP1]|nr:MOSC domain-containing protein [filamentous cyanobacterium CCP2]PSB54887.1 MOSC domain-containing protein [filamentous cyanobacterium CCP1]